MLIRTAGTLCSLASSFAFAKAPDYYFSYQYGLARSNIEFNSDAKFKNDNGTSKVVEFFWGDAPFAKLIGGVNLSPKNKYAGYMLGVIIDDRDIITVKQFNTEDELLKSELDLGYSRGLSFGMTRSTTTEYSWTFSRDGANFRSLTFGLSNYPATVHVSEEPTPEDEKHFFDPRPEFQFFHFGIDFDPIRAALLDGKEVSEYTGDWFFLQSKLGFGFYHFQLSDTQYSSFYKNPDDQYGLKSESGFEPMMGLHLAVGAHTSISHLWGSLVGAVGYYYQAPPQAILTRLYKLNETTKGYYFSADGSPHHGLLGRLAVSF